MKDQIENLFKQYGGQLRLSQALAAGVSRTRFYTWQNRGLIQKISRGVYRLSTLPSLSQPDLVIVSLRFPNSIICLLSALSFHQLTTHIPHHVDVAIKRKTRVPVLDFPPIRAYQFNEVSFLAGAKSYLIDNASVQVYDVEKTLVDCFKFRQKIGMDIFLESIKMYKKNYPIKINQLLNYAKICRVDTKIRPYLESML